MSPREHIARALFARDREAVCEPMEWDDCADDLTKHYWLLMAADAVLHAIVDDRRELLAEVRRLQAWISRLVPDELSCEDLCPVVCAGPCVGRPLSESWPA